MKRLFVWITILTVLFSSGIVFAGQSGGNAPLPAFAQWFTYPDGKPCPMPCLFGIQINMTKLDQVDAVLKAHPSIHKLNDYATEEGFPSRWYWTGARSASADLGFDAEDKTFLIYRIVVVELGNVFPITIFDMLTVLGIPDGVSLSIFENSAQSEYRYSGRDYVLFVAVEDGYTEESPCAIDPNQRIRGIFIYSTAYYQELQSAPSVHRDRILYSWAGLVRATYWERFYRNDQYASKSVCPQWQYRR